MATASDLSVDLTEAVDAAAGRYWERLSTDVSWADADPVVRHELREQVTPLVTAAAGVLVESVRDQVSIERTIESTKRALRGLPPAGVGLDADVAARVADPASLALLVDSDGWGGLMQVRADLVAAIEGDSAPWPLVRWDIPLPRAEALLEALEALDEIGDVMGATNGEGPNGWTEERTCLGEALEHLIRTGRVARTDTGHLTLPPAEGNNPL
jgi:hypothetical protein